MRSRRGPTGSASLSALLAVMLLSAISAGAALALRGLLDYQERSLDRSRSRSALACAGREVVSALAHDPTPEADSGVDPVWGVVGFARSDGMTVELADLSSALNPNWMRVDLLAAAAMGGLLEPGVEPADIERHREGRGFTTDLALSYGDLISPEALARWFSAYGYANVNTSDARSLGALCLIRTGDPSAARELEESARELQDSRRILTPEELPGLLGQGYAALFPLVNAEPGLNVHFMDPALLEALLCSVDSGVEHPEELVRRLVEGRSVGELTREDLEQALGEAADGMIGQHLGVLTWFWRVSVSRGTERLEMVVARLPGATGRPPRFQLVEERYEP